MAEAKKQYVKFTTPIGVAQYPKLERAFSWDDSSQRSVPDPDGQRSTKLVVADKELATNFIKIIDKAIKDSGIKPKHKPYADEEKDGEKTGNVVFNLKAYGKTKDGKDNKLVFYDASGQRIAGGVDVTGGSKLRLQGYIAVSKMGCRLNIREVQVIELAEREGEGFGAVEGGSFKRDEFADANTDVDNENDNETSSDNETEENSTSTDEEEF